MNKTYCLSSKDFNTLKAILECQDLHVDNFAFTLFAGDDTFIILHEEFEKLEDDMKKIIVAHEVAHILGIKDEEKADIEALSLLTKQSQRDKLIDMWEFRHGKRYEGDKSE